MAAITRARSSLGEYVQIGESSELRVGLYPPPEHSLEAMRDPQVALGVLAGKGNARGTRLCVCCLLRDNGCPFPRGSEPYGLCGEYMLDERDIPETERRVTEYLRGA